MLSEALAEVAIADTKALILYAALGIFVASLETSTVTGIERVQHQLWHVSRVLHRKYTLIRVALLLASAASVIFVLIGIVEAIEADNALTR